MSVLMGWEGTMSLKRAGLSAVTPPTAPRQTLPRRLM